MKITDLNASGVIAPKDKVKNLKDVLFFKKYGRCASVISWGKL